MARTGARRLSQVVLVIALLTTAGAAGAAPLDRPDGLLCGSVIQIHSASGQYLTYRATLRGGPAAGTGTLTCTIQVDHPTHGTTANDAAAVSASGTGAVAFPPQDAYFTVDMLWASAIHLCAQFVPAGGPPLYWDERTGWWSTDPSATCALVGHAPFLAAVSTGADHYGGTNECSVLAREFGADGDVTVGEDRIWDCPPYA